MSTTEANLQPELATDDTLLSDQALADLFGTEEPADATATPEPATPKADEPPKVETPPSAATPEPVAAAEDGIDISQLDDDKAEATPPAHPAVDPDSDYVSQVRQWIPNRESLGAVVTGYQRSVAIERALESGDAQALAQAMGPQAAKLVDVIYQNAKEDLVQRYIDEKSGPKDPEVQELKKQVFALTQFIQNGIQQQQQTTAQAERMNQAQFVNKTIDDLFDKVRFPKDDRHAAQRDLIRKAVFVDLSSDPKILDRALKGDVSAIRGAFRPNMEKFVAADKPKTLAKQAARTNLEQQPKPIQAPATATAASTDELSWEQEAANFVAEVQRQKKR